jgi:hypothetical protein
MPDKLLVAMMLKHGMRWVGLRSYRADEDDLEAAVTRGLMTNAPLFRSTFAAGKDDDLALPGFCNAFCTLPLTELHDPLSTCTL